MAVHTTTELRVKIDIPLQTYYSSLCISKQDTKRERENTLLLAKYLYVSQEAKEQSQDLLAKARAQMEEQDDEIKKLNEAILNAKCHAIRDAQLREREEIIRAMQEEDVRG